MRLALHSLVGITMVAFGALAQRGIQPMPDRVFGAAVIVAGTVLVWLGVSGRRIGAAGWVAVVVLGFVGLAGSLLFAREDIGCMYCYHRGLGYPWGYVHTAFTHDDMPTVQQAHQIMADDPGIATRSFDTFHAVFDGVFWVLAALPVVAVVTQIRLALRRTSAILAAASSLPRPPVDQGPTPV